MAGELAGYPFWQLRFDAAGARIAGDDADALAAAAAAGEISDLLVFSHGWNNNHAKATSLYERFFAQLAEVAPERGAIGVAGVYWPSMLWPGDEADAGGGGAAGFAAPDREAETIAALERFYSDPVQAAALERALDLLAKRPDDFGELERFQALLPRLAAGDDPAPEDAGDAALFTLPAEEVFDRTAELAPGDDQGGAAGFLDPIQRLWDGAKEGLRLTTYYQMKIRAGVVARNGLGPYLARLPEPPRLHLIGHSFGGRLSAYALTALEQRRPASLTLLQAAFSHFAFAAELPFGGGRGGGLAGLQARVAGPVIITHSLRDLAVGDMYPFASSLVGDDSAAFDALRFRFGAMGHDGAQSSSATDCDLAPAGHPYAFADGALFNLDGNAVIVDGDGPSGAHSDIVHPEIAWAVLSAARLTSA